MTNIHSWYFGPRYTIDSGNRFIQIFDLSRRILGIKTGVLVFPAIWHRVCSSLNKRLLTFLLTNSLDSTPQKASKIPDFL